MGPKGIENRVCWGGGEGPKVSKDRDRGKEGKALIYKGSEDRERDKGRP